MSYGSASAGDWQLPDGSDPDVDFIYTPFELINAELEQRWNDRDLDRKVAAYLNDDIPAVLRDQPAAIVTAHLATPNFWTLEFGMLARAAGLPAVMFEYLEDIFVTQNFDKAALAKMRVATGINNHGPMWCNRRVIDLSGSQERKPLRSLRTAWNESFVEFHHRLTLSHFPSAIMFDASSWYARNSACSTSRYLAIMALALRNAVLFENFLTSESEYEFTNSIVVPSFLEIERHFGVRPLVVFISPRQKEQDRLWWCYPKAIMPMLPDPPKSSRNRRNGK
jgi:hypothetical protein